MLNLSLEERLRDLQQRLADVCASDAPSLRLHWSDATLLLETIEALRRQQITLEHTSRALTAAMGLINR